MKVLYLGHYRDSTGWAQAAIDYILALDAVGIDVVPRPVKLNANQAELPARILELEKQSSIGCDICIQHVLPHLMDYSSDFVKNIGLFVTETTSFKQSSWPIRLNTMDEIWVPCKSVMQSCHRSSVNVPINIVPHATDVEKFDCYYERMNVEEIAGDFTFYFIGDLNRRKHLAALIKAFHLEFSPNEPVSLVIKTSKYGTSAQDTFQQVSTICDKIKANLKLYPKIENYKREVIMPEYMSHDNLMRIHHTFDSFVMPSFGEAWCIPAFDAMGFGNTPVVSNVGGPKEYLVGGYKVSGNWEPVLGMTETFGDLFTAREEWYNVNIDSLRSGMRRVYEMDDEERHVWKQAGKKKALEYSHSNIGNIMKEILNG